MTERLCETCEWWFQAGELDGECRRYPPRKYLMITDNGILQAEGPPRTFADYFCGEHTPRHSDGG